MRNFKRVTFTLLGACALIGLHTFGCSAGDESVDPVGPAETIVNVENQDQTAAVSEEAPAPEVIENRFADLAELFKEADDALKANPGDADALAEIRSLNAEAASRMNLVGSVEIDAGHSVKFYEPMPGVAVVHEQMPQGKGRVSALDGQKFDSIAQIHRALRPTMAVPKALLDVDVRASTVLASMPPSLELDRDLSEQELPLMPKISSSCNEFKAAGGCPGGSQSVGWCQCNKVGNFTKTHTTDYSNWFIAPYKGTVSVEFSVSGVVLMGISAVAGEFHFVWTRSPWGNGDKFCDCGTWQACGEHYCYRSHAGRVFNASGDEYHYGGNYSNFL
jgi:hypothetical protein